MSQTKHVGQNVHGVIVLAQGPGDLKPLWVRQSLEYIHVAFHSVFTLRDIAVRGPSNVNTPFASAVILGDESSFHFRNYASAVPESLPTCVLYSF